MVSVDYTNTKNQVKELQIVVEKCNDSINSIRKEMSRSEGCWIGRGGDALRTSLQECIVRIEDIKTRVVSTAAMMDKAAEEIKQKDEEIATAVRSTAN